MVLGVHASLLLPGETSFSSYLCSHSSCSILCTYLLSFISPLDFSSRIGKQNLTWHITSLAEEMSRIKKKRKKGENNFRKLYTRVPRGLRGVSSFEARKGNGGTQVELQLGQMKIIRLKLEIKMTNIYDLTTEGGGITSTLVNVRLDVSGRGKFHFQFCFRATPKGSLGLCLGDRVVPWNQGFQHTKQMLQVPQDSV